jgi:ubiquinone/menaquinone biosynthesis C-methylase UbiE
MNQNQITEAYDAAAGMYVEKCFNELSYKPLDRMLLDRFVKMTNNGKLLDLGCGPGQTTKYIHEKGGNIIGIDISSEMISAARNLNPAIQFNTDDIFNLKFNNNELAGILSFYSIVNFQYPDINIILTEFYRVMDNKGILLLAFHVGEKELNVGNFFETGKPLDFYYFDENKIIEMLTKIGFKIVDALVRFPYKEEYPSKRAYVFAEKG